MGTYHGPQVRLTRRAATPVAETPKHTNVRRPTRPGMHGRRRTRASLYGERFAEKQKLCAYYNIRDRQFTRHIEQAQAKPGSEPFVRAAMEPAGEAEIQIPPWLSVDNDNLRARVMRLPASEEIRPPFEIDVAKVIEMYTR